MQEITKDCKGAILKKHVNAIHCSNNLTLIQRKLFNALLYNAYPNLPYSNIFKVSSKVLCNLIGYNSNDHKKLKKALIGLITIAIEWNVIDANDGSNSKWKASSILSAAELSNGMCTYEYSQIIKELFYRPEIYGRIDIDVISKFKSSYGLALYENCIRYQSLAQTPSFSIKTFRVLMGVFGDKYKAFKDLKKRVLNIAVNEVNSLSPIYITPEIERVNQQVTEIRFKIRKNQVLEQKDIIFANEGETEKILVDIFGLSTKTMLYLFEEYGKECVKGKIDLIISSDSFRQGAIKSLPGYLIESLRKDYKASKSSKKVIEAERRKREVAVREVVNREKQREDKYNRYLKSITDRYYSSLAPKRQEVLLTDFISHAQAQTGPLYGWYKKYGLKHKGVQACLNAFIRENCQIQILSYDDFCSIVDEKEQ